MQATPLALRWFHWQSVQSQRKGAADQSCLFTLVQNSAKDCKIRTVEHEETMEANKACWKIMASHMQFPAGQNGTKEHGYVCTTGSESFGYSVV